MAEKSNVASRETLLATRRSLLGEPVSLQVHSWLRPVYHRPPSGFTLTVAKAGMSGMVSALNAGLKANPHLRTAMQNVSKFISAPLGPIYAKAFENIKRPESNVFATFVSVVYARAALVLLSSAMDAPGIVADLKNILSDSKSTIDRYLELQGKLDANFVGHLVTCAEVEAQFDPHFQKVMERSSKLFLETHKPKESKRDPFADRGSRLDLLDERDESAWWAVPTNLAFAMTVWQ